jgi:hypothetical protein
MSTKIKKRSKHYLFQMQILSILNNWLVVDETSLVFVLESLLL